MELGKFNQNKWFYTFNLAKVTFFSALISSYATNYLEGFKYHSKFMWLSMAFTLSVLLLVMSNHMLLLTTSWFSMRFFISQLIGTDKD
jgi:NAD(P)H-quinone oxidoreductase subunit 5